MIGKAFHKSNHFPSGWVYWTSVLSEAKKQKTMKPMKHKAKASALSQYHILNEQDARMCQYLRDPKTPKTTQNLKHGR